MTKIRTIRIIMVVMLCFFGIFGISCVHKSTFTIWYGIAPTGGYMLALSENATNLVVARIPADVLASYRRQLAVQGMESDDLGAVQSLFGIKGDHYLRADAILWQEAGSYLDRLETQSGFKVAHAGLEIHRLSALIEAAPVLSKNALPDTLMKLAGPRTTGDDISGALKLLAKYKPLVMYYDMGLFLDPSLSSEELKRWTVDWTAHALRAAAR